MRRFYVALKSLDKRGVRGEVTYDQIKASDATAAIASAIEASGIPVSEITYIWVSEHAR